MRLVVVNQKLRLKIKCFKMSSNTRCRNSEIKTHIDDQHTDKRSTDKENYKAKYENKRNEIYKTKYENNRKEIEIQSKI